MNASPSLALVQDFRAALYACFEHRADALFELTDALLTADPVPSPVHLSLVPVHRRGWGSLYAALVHGTVNTTALRALLARHPLADGQAIYAVDVSVWARCDAETSPARGFYYHPSRHSAGQPIVAGWAYQWIAQLSFARDSWTAPLDVRRLHPTENSNTVATAQVRAVVQRLPPDAPVPIFVFDAGYDPVASPTGVDRLSGRHRRAPAREPLLLRRPAAAERDRATTPPRAQVRLQRSHHLARADG